MKYAIIILLNSITVLAPAQEVITYKGLIAMSDSLVKERNYRKAAETYTKAFALSANGVPETDIYNAACCWALCSQPNNAFHYLDHLAFLGNYSDVECLLTDADLDSLREHPCWKGLMRQVKNNRERKTKDYSHKNLMSWIDSLSVEDQRWRKKSITYENVYKGTPQYDTIYRDKISFNMGIADSMNYYAIKSILATYGYPTIEMIGKESSNHFWALIQHQDRRLEFQDSILPLLKQAADKGQATMVNYAYFYDRVKVNKGELQLCGTQFRMNKKGDSFEPEPVLEPEKLNERRKSIGLTTEEEYIKHANSLYFGSFKK